MSRVRASGWLLQKKIMMIVGAMLAGAVLAVALQPVFPVSGAGSNAASAQLSGQGPAVVFQVHPTFVKYPPRRMRDHGIWLIAAGLQPDQEVKIQMVWGIEGLITDISSVLEYTDEERGGIFANVHGAIAVAFERGFRSVDRDFLFYQVYEPVSLHLVDAISGETLAVAPMVVCGPDLEEPWCNAASDLAPIE